MSNYVLGTLTVLNQLVSDSHITVDGYTIDLTSGGGSNQALVFSSNTVVPGTVVFLNVAQNFTKSQNVASVVLADGTNINTDASLSNIFTITINGNRTLKNPTNLTDGGSYTWIITQGAGGGFSLSFDTLFKFPGGSAPILTPTVGAIDIITGICNSNGQLCCVFQGNFL